MAFVVGVSAFASPSSATPSANDTTTDAYLTALYDYEQAVLAGTQASRAAMEGFTSKIGTECAGVLKSAPPEASSSTPFARRVGESKREDEQLNELEEELGRALGLTLDQSESQEMLAFVSATRSLHWTNPTITRRVDADNAAIEETLSRPIPDVCVDMRAWVASGYKTLSPATRELRTKREEAARKPQPESTRSLSILLAPYENPEDKTLVAKTRVLARERIKALDAADIVERVDAVLGIVHEREAAVGHPPAGTVVLGKGKTDAGGTYEVLLEQSARRPKNECEPSRPLKIRIVTTLGTQVSGCFARSESSYPTVNCDEGLLRIEARTPAAINNARLRLSNGRTITSSVVIVPANLGGPTGFYYQLVRGPTPIPVSLTELNALGRPMRVYKLQRFAGCTKHLLKYLPNGIRTLAHGRVPGGPSFSIQGEAYRFIGNIQFALKVTIAGAGGGDESPSGRKPNIFSWATWNGCQPHPYTILYGLLKQPGDRVFARTAGKLRALHRATIPTHLHAGGVLVYTAASTAPNELIVRDRAGKTILTEKLGRVSAEALETCQGEAE